MNNHRGQIIFIVTMIFILLVTFTGLSATDTNDTTDNQSDNYKHVLTNNTIHDTNNIKVNKNIKNNAVDNNTNITNDTQTPQNDTIDNNTNITASNQTTEITRKNTKINITNVKTDNTSVILSADITDSQGNSVTVGKAIFKINGKTVSNKLDVINGTVTFNYTANGLSAKNYTITTVYGGNEQYFPSKDSGTLSILKKNTKKKVANIK
ncbi:MAG: Ig-like domain-containing protein, partial [Methanosphaera sp.]|nr:Ig-like domain-containing protein [Methanosphaera sp.]